MAWRSRVKPREAKVVSGINEHRLLPGIAHAGYFQAWHIDFDVGLQTGKRSLKVIRVVEFLGVLE